ncbi:MAG TPA: TrkA C-terminal domain-containing protein [Thermoleophilaceae bacterium]|nr:TrkA C-terminal domain-containing protein [Thermoleophilaceae bacterium]
MVALVSVLIIVLLSLLITRVATVALSLTGMSRDSARFQARSALTGVGFTTSEAEDVVNHPVRRRIVGGLMLVGSAGLVTAVSSLILSFGGAHNQQRIMRGFILVAGLAVLFALSRSEWVDRRLSVLIGKFLRWRGYHVRDFSRLLALQGDWAVSELVVEQDDWIDGRTLAELKLRDEHIDVLGIHRPDGEYTGVPHGSDRVNAGDVLLLYSTEQRLAELDERKRGAAGDEAHREASGFSEAVAG